MEKGGIGCPGTPYLARHPDKKRFIFPHPLSTPMSRKLKVVIDKFFQNADGELVYDIDVDRLRSHPNIEVEFMKPGKDDPEVKPEDLKDCDIFFGVSTVTRNSLEGANRLKHISRCSAGFDNADLDACTEKGIYLTHTPLGVTEPVAQTVFGSMIACVSHFKKMNEILRGGGWHEGQDYKGTELLDKTLGIIGFGNIGSRIAEMSVPFNMRVLTYDPYITKERLEKFDVEQVDLQTLLKESDFVSVNCPLTPETTGLIKREDFKLMKKTAYFFNTARGGMYSDKDLADALNEGWIAGAAIDVYENEPFYSGKPNMLGNPLLDCEDILLFPHHAGSTEECVNRIMTMATDAIIQTADGEIPDRVVNYELLDPEVLKEKRTSSFVYKYRERELETE